MYAKTNHTGFYKDLTTKAVINTNDEEYQRILLERKKKKEISNLASDVSNLKQEITEIKSLLLVLINGNK